MFGPATKSFCTTFGTLFVLFLVSKKKRNWEFNLVVNALLSGVCACIRVFAGDAHLPIYTVIQMIFQVACACFITRRAFGQTFIVFAVSFGINNTVYFFSTMMSIVAAMLLGFNSESTAGFVFLFASQLLLIFLLFRSKRLHNSLDYLQADSRMTGIFFSLIMLSFIILLGGSNEGLENARLNLTSVLYTTACSVFFYFWWRENIKVGYNKMLQAQEKAEFEQSLARKDAEIADLCAQNIYWNTLVHSDNKLLPALYHAVVDRLPPTAENEAFARELDDMMHQRFKANELTKQQYAKLPTTNIIILDEVVLPYYKKKASEAGSLFDVLVECDVAFLARTHVSATDLQHLIANLLENALYAMRDCENKMLRLRFSVDENNHYRIAVSDSGAAFSDDVLSKMGAAPITSHAGDGGSGIGLYQTSALLQKSGASFIVDAHELPRDGYTKTISVVFDQQSHIAKEINQ